MWVPGIFRISSTLHFLSNNGRIADTTLLDARYRITNLSYLQVESEYDVKIDVVFW